MEQNRKPESAMHQVGDIQVRTNMNCRVLLDGQDVGLTRDAAITLKDIPFGKHVIEAVTERHEGRKDVFLGVKQIQIKIALEEKGGELEVTSALGTCTVRFENETHETPVHLTDIRKGTYVIDISGDGFQFQDRVRIESLKTTTYVINEQARSEAELRDAQERYRQILGLPESSEKQMRAKLHELDRIVIRETRFDVSEGIETHRRLIAGIRQTERNAEVQAAVRAEHRKHQLNRIRRNGIVAAIVILVLGTGAYIGYRYKRNRDAEAAFRLATESGREADYRAYMDQFGESSAHGPAVSEELSRFETDRTAFAKAQQTGTSAGFQQYLDSFGARALFREEALAQAQLLAAREKLPEMIEQFQLVEIPTSTLFLGEAGSPTATGPDTRPPMYVKIESFLMASRETTWTEYTAFCRATGHPIPDDAGFGKGSRPVINVSYADAMAYCRWLSQESGLDVRLPSEAEWEAACRAGSVTRFFWGPVMNRAYCHSGQKQNGRTQAAGSTQPNHAGLFDMSGNVFEWCADHYRDPYDRIPEGEPEGSSYRYPDRYETNSSGNPVFTAWGNRRVTRGGSFRSSDFQCGSSVRAGAPPETARSDLGFRIAVTIPR